MPPRDRRIHGPARADRRKKGLKVSASGGSGGVSITPPPATVILKTINPIVLAGGVSVIPSPATVILKTINPFVIAGEAETELKPKSLYWSF